MRKYLILLVFCVCLSGCGKNKKEPDVEINRESVDVITTDAVTFETEVLESTEEIQTTTFISELESTTEELTTVVEETTTEKSETNELSISFVKDLVTVLMGSHNQADIDRYLSTIALDNGFKFNTVVNKETEVSIKSIGVNSTNSQEYLAIVVLRQEGGISKFTVLVEFNDSKLSKITFTKF